VKQQSRSLTPGDNPLYHPVNSIGPASYRAAMTTTPEDKSSSAEETPSDRVLAGELYGFTRQAIIELNDNTRQLVRRTVTERFAEAHLLALQAIYHELRYGHDQTERQTAAMAAHTQALDEHADAMDKLRGALADHADALSRYRFGDR
jgi:hypothetical protein